MPKKRGRPKKLGTVKPPYSITLEVNGGKFIGSGQTIEDAILALKIPEKIGTRAIFTVEHDGKVSRPVRLLAWQTKRLLASGMTGQVQRVVLIKRLTL